MENQAEVIKSQMLDTRTALTEKLEAVENLVTSKVKDTTEAVAETVENVKDAVESTVTTVTDSVQQTVETVKETFNLRRQVEDHPWAMLGGSVVLGYVAGSLLARAPEPWTRHAGHGYRTPPRLAPGYEQARPPAVSERYAAARDVTEPGWGEKLSEALAPAMTRLRELVVGTVAGLVGEMILNATPENLRPDVTEVIDDVTTGLGGKPVRPFAEHPNGHH
jgi:ElaB/YqjD/DUF883 family membrane-anchored ribosome-binding protein